MSTGSRPPRIAVLWKGIGYLHASLKALVAEGADVLLYHELPIATAPFDTVALTEGMEAHGWYGSIDAGEIAGVVDEFDPDAVLVGSWHVGQYRQVARRLHGRTLRIIGLSNPWLGRPKQWGGLAISPWVIRPSFDAAFVPGEWAAVFARKLGFPDERIVWGLNTGDHPRFAELAEQRGGELPPKAFLFVGRLVPDKAIDVLAAAYDRYRSRVDDPWPLHIVGTGPDEALLRDRDGVSLFGFQQPADLPKFFDQAGCFVLSSRFEPWGVVVHEAVSAGLPVISTNQVGASTRLVLDGYNGVLVSSDDAEALAAAFGRIHDATDDERRAMGTASELLARQYSPQRWAEHLLRRIPDLRGQIGLNPAPWLSRARG